MRIRRPDQEEKGKDVKINIESSTACNARCTFCPRPSMARKGGEMDDSLFRKILGDCKDMGIRICSPFLYGEPFMFPRIWDWLDILRDEGFSIILYTNAERVDVGRLVEYENIRSVTCSVNATTKETYDEVMRGPDYDRVQRNVKDLFSKAPFLVRASFIRTKENDHEAATFPAVYPKTSIGTLGNWTGGRNSIRNKKDRSPCYSLLGHITVLWDGRVVPCCMDCNAKMVLGDVGEQSLREIWNSYSWMRRKHKNLDFNIPICRDCDYNG
jgi:radical SAM protein with 4Fe4S-binding SPASM domain